MGKISLDSELIKELSNLLEENNLSEITVTQGRFSVKVAKQIGSSQVVAQAVVPNKIDNNQKEISQTVISDVGAVKSPMVGTVYLAPSPDADPFISIGQEVKEGDQLFIIEAMKTMNPVKSPFNGKIKKILAKNEMPVEYDEVLAIIEVV
ncbi:MAG: acetyl-CoA carboxylase biotin carboxyl carrier protein subunit [Pelagibacterales bacterium]|nr:acetyl-CoA carboxylase biotin carboxyl carrier protein subunit [Pelagibacterales bacterium]|tara:strand:+ start:4834 stop:5283 length:450 start_codon:yes stop_codon:yes gene_type:complete